MDPLLRKERNNLTALSVAEMTCILKQLGREKLSRGMQWRCCRPTEPETNSTQIANNAHSTFSISPIILIRSKRQPFSPENAQKNINSRIELKMILKTTPANLEFQQPLALLHRKRTHTIQDTMKYCWRRFTTPTKKKQENWGINFNLLNNKF